MRVSKQFILLFALVLMGSGCRSRQTSNPEITFLTLKGPSAMGMVYLMDQSDQLINQKLNIEILDEPMLTRARMLSDKPELTVLPLNMAAILYNKGLPYQVIAIPVWGTLFLFGRDSTITSWDSLKNKRVFLMGKGTTPDIIFRYLLKYHGLIPDRNITLDYSFPTHIDLANAVSAGSADLAVISEPMVSLARAHNPSIHQLMNLNTEWSAAFPDHPEMPQTALMGRIDFIHDHPDWIEKIANAWSRSIDQVNRYPLPAAKRIVYYKILPDTTIALQAIPRCNMKFSYASEIAPQINQYLQVLFNFNPDAVGGQLPDEQFIYQKPDH